MQFLVMLEESPDHSPVLARVDSVPAALSTDSRSRDVVTLYGSPNSQSLALALAVAVESQRATSGVGAFRHLGLWPERGAVGDAAWRDEATGELITSELDIPFDVLSGRARALHDEFGAMLQRLVAGLSMPDWPEGSWRAIGIDLESLAEPTVVGVNGDDLLSSLREADGLTYEYEGV